MINKILKTTILLFSFIILIACAPDVGLDFDYDYDYLSISDIAGSWIATTATFDTSKTLDTSQIFDILEEGGPVTIVIQNDARFTFTIKIPGEPDVIYTGKLVFADLFWWDVIFDDNIEEGQFFITLENDILNIRGHVKLDLDGNEIEDIGTLRLVMDRN